MQRERALAKQEVTSPGSEVREDNGYGVGGYFLPQGTSARVVCVFTYYLASAFSLTLTWGEKYTEHQKVFPDGMCHFFSTVCILVYFTILNIHNDIICLTKKPGYGFKFGQKWPGM